MTVETSTSGGRLRGVVGEVLEFHGVPYATAPRFGAPTTTAPWTGVRPAATPGSAAPQVVNGDAPVPDMAVAAIGEDCLNAEIWTPSLDDRRPVLVWIPGGAYKTGGNALSTYDGTRLAADGDLVVVGLNYRLGALGFLAADDVPSNLGLRDLIAGLEWIQNEIHAFGGDPTRVTVMGESAGAGAIAHLLAVPGIDRLVTGAIVASGAPGATLTADTATLVADAVMAAAGVDDVAALRTLPLEGLLEAQAAADAELLLTVGMMPFHPWIDDDLLPAAPLEAARHDRLAAVPLVVGTTDQEMELFRAAVPDLPEEFALAFLQPKLAAALGSATEEQARNGLAAAGDLVEAIADTDLHLPALALADTHARRGLPVWRYRFDWPAPVVGAAHATDLPFHFGTLDVSTWREFLAAGPAADTLSERMRAAWSAFCHRGIPACEPLGEWPRHTITDRVAIRLGPAVTIEADPDAERRRAWTGE